MKKDGKLVPNPCFMTEVQLPTKSLSETDSIKRHHGTMDSFITRKKPKNYETQTVQAEVVEDRAGPSATPPDDTSNPKKDDDNSLESIIEYLKKIDLKGDTILEKLSEEINRSGKSSVDSRSHQSDAMSDHLHGHKALRMAKSVQEVINNTLVKDVFVLEEGRLVCGKCPPGSGKGINCEDTSYNRNRGVAQPSWFINMKTAIERHVTKDIHIKHVRSSKAFQGKVEQKKLQIMDTMRNLSYFAVKSELSFSNFPLLLGTVSRCDVDLGNINHTRAYVTKYLECLNRVLMEDTSTWLQFKKEDDSVTVTLDVGTCQGVTLLAVLFIREKEVKLANVLMATSKKGRHLADLCYEALKMEGLVDEAVIKSKICGIVGDGAFIKGNKPFKARLQACVGKELTFRWDLLHLVNRAHIPARGKSDLEKEKETKKGSAGDRVPETEPAKLKSRRKDDQQPSDKADEADTEQHPDIDHDDSDVDFDEDPDNITAEVEVAQYFIPKTIGYIQKSAKTYRTGIKYTDLLKSTLGDFKRPKIWSSTRMVLYELELLSRFLENKIFYEVPVDVEITSSLYSLVMFCLKIILKRAQSTDISHDFVHKVIIDPDFDYGKKLMTQCLNVIVQYLSLGYYEVLDEMPDILSDPVEMKPADEKNRFFVALTKYMDFHKKNFAVQNTARTTRGAKSPDEIMLEVKLELDQYIYRLWDGIRLRLEIADTKSMNCTSYSEAPAESIFSCYERIQAGRESMTLQHVNCMLRVTREGPPAGTRSAHKISAEALELWPSSLGERFTTNTWYPGLTSSTINNIRNADK